MPLVAQQPDLLPVADARQERVHQRNALDFVRVLRRVSVRDHQADIVTDDLHLAIAELLDHRVNVLRESLLVVAGFRHRRLAGTGKIRREHDAAVVQLFHQRQPHMARFGIAVQQDDGRLVAVAGFEIMQFDTVRVDRTTLDRGIRRSVCSWQPRARKQKGSADTPCDLMEQVHGIFSGDGAAGFA